MFKYFLSYFWRSEADTEAPLSLDEAYSVVKDADYADKTEELEPEPVREISDYEAQNKVGKITQIVNGICLIDDIHEFECTINQFNVGTKVSYQLIKSCGDVKVVNVDIVENDWNVVETGTRTWHKRTLICAVVQREGRVLVLNPGQLRVNLNEVSSEFVPIEGDWVELDVKCELDENVVDLNGRIIEINKLSPLRAQIKLGVITHWNSYEKNGIVNKNIFFEADSLNCGYVPVTNDKVIAEIIESSQGSCTWRALKIIPDYLHKNDRLNHSSSGKVEDFLDEHASVDITNNIKLTFTKLGESKLFTVDVKCVEEVQLICVEIPKVNGQCSADTPVDHQIIKAEQTLTLRFICKAKNIGDSRELLIFHFDDFKIKRWIDICTVIRSNKSHNQEFKKETRSYISREQRETIRGRHFMNKPRFVNFQYPEYPVPDRLLTLITKFKDENQINGVKIELEKMKPCLAASLTYMNFEDKFHTLIYLDEIHTFLEMRNYDQKAACFIKSGEFLMLEIENMAERRPSVMLGDRVIARNCHDSTSLDYEGIIHKIAKNHIYIKFTQIFHDSYDGEDYSVFILASRTTYKREHYAIHLAIRNLGKELLFPTKTSQKEPQLDFTFDKYEDIQTLNNLCPSDKNTFSNIIGRQNLLEKIRKFQEGTDKDLPVPKLEWHNQSLNYYQKEAVRNIILGVCRPLPYLIFGPPGTGKTVTLVETVLQILRLMPHSRILVSAPSNSAADLLGLRLIDSGILIPGDLIRLVAFTAIAGLPAKLAPYCATATFERENTETQRPLVTASGLIFGYNCSVIGRHRITVCTCSTAGILHNMNFTKGHFTHIVVDEAGQTSEPTLLIPLGFLDVTCGQAILAGDPMQLGPVVLSSLASDYGLRESFLERQINRFPYMRDTHGFAKTSGYDPRLITKLIYNYRSLSDLLKLPSVLFYNDDLIPTISDESGKEVELLKQVKDILPETKNGKLASIVFHSVLGENLQNDDSPSWYNLSEAAQVFYYVNELYRLGLTSSDIGIITPYKAQTKQLLDLFKEAEFDLPKVGTVEDFQGQEFNVIILSTVRSNRKLLSVDIRYTMGFISNPRRLNVSITRAKSLLLIVGNGNLLLTDRCWRSVIQYCQDKGTFVGADLYSK